MIVHVFPRRIAACGCAQSDWSSLLADPGKSLQGLLQDDLQATHVCCMDTDPQTGMHVTYASTQVANLSVALETWKPRGSEICSRP